jgi:hypothetical protein
MEDHPMTATDTQSLRDDLAFLRALVEPTDGGQRYWRAFGEAYLAAGVCYGAQLLLVVAQMLGLLPATSGVSLAIGILPTVVFIGLLVWIIVRHRAAQAGAGLMARAVGNLFGVLGMANLGLAAAIGWVAIREHNMTTWLIYPCCVFILQGAAWLVALSLRRKAWYAWVAAGWIVTGLGMAVAIEATGWFIAFAAAGLVLCMALPGWHLMRTNRYATSAVA